MTVRPPVSAFSQRPLDGLLSPGTPSPPSSPPRCAEIDPLRTGGNLSLWTVRRLPSELQVHSHGNGDVSGVQAGYDDFNGAHRLPVTSRLLGFQQRRCQTNRPGPQIPLWHVDAPKLWLSLRRCRLLSRQRISEVSMFRPRVLRTGTLPVPAIRPRQQFRVLLQPLLCRSVILPASSCSWQRRRLSPTTPSRLPDRPGSPWFAQ